MRFDTSSEWKEIGCLLGGNGYI